MAGTAKRLAKPSGPRQADTVMSRFSILAAVLVLTACGSREAEAPQSEEQAAQEFGAKVRGGILDGSIPTTRATPVPAPPRKAEVQPGTQVNPEVAARSGKAPPRPSWSASCGIKSGEQTYQGPCAFYPEASGDFSLARSDGAEMMPNVASISVGLVGDGRAEVVSRTPAGKTRRWGYATQPEGYPDCWQGPNFSVCAS